MQSHISVILDKALSDAALSAEDGYQLINCSEEDFPALLEAAGILRDRHKGRTVTYSRKVFLPVTNLCRDRCSYCTFRKDPPRPGRLDHESQRHSKLVGACQKAGL